MSAQETTTSNPAAGKGAEPCKMGCGFFGSSATAGCCSTCWRSEMQKKKPSEEKKDETGSSPTALKKRSLEERDGNDTPPRKRVRIDPGMEKGLSPTVTSEESPSPSSSKPSTAPITTTVPSETKNEKKKKFSSILAGMMKQTKERDSKVEKESLRKGLGGGNFEKVTKI